MPEHNYRPATVGSLEGQAFLQVCMVTLVAFITSALAPHQLQDKRFGWHVLPFDVKYSNKMNILSAGGFARGPRF